MFLGESFGISFPRWQANWELLEASFSVSFWQKFRWVDAWAAMAYATANLCVTTTIAVTSIGGSTALIMVAASTLEAHTIESSLWFGLTCFLVAISSVFILESLVLRPIMYAAAYRSPMYQPKWNRTHPQRKIVYPPALLIVEAEQVMEYVRPRGFKKTNT